MIDEAAIKVQEDVERRQALKELRERADQLDESSCDGQVFLAIVKKLKSMRMPEKNVTGSMRAKSLPVVKTQRLMEICIFPNKTQVGMKRIFVRTGTQIRRTANNEFEMLLPNGTRYTFVSKKATGTKFTLVKSRCAPSGKRAGVRSAGHGPGVDWSSNR